jgi:hypothetical protein
MRTTKDLIAELRTEASQGEYAYLAVGFPNETKMLSARKGDGDALRELNALVEQGGHPLGFIKFGPVAGKHLSVSCRPLVEYADDPFPGQLLREICEGLAEKLQNQGLGISVRRGHLAKAIIMDNKFDEPQHAELSINEILDKLCAAPITSERWNQYVDELDPFVYASDITCHGVLAFFWLLTRDYRQSKECKGKVKELCTEGHFKGFDEVLGL